MVPIPPEIEQKIRQLQACIQQADALEEARRVDEALAAYYACLQMAAREHIPLLDGLLAEIWMGIAFCYADRDDWPQALEWYDRIEAALLSAPAFCPDPNSPEAQANMKKWTPYLPEGVKVMFSPNYPAAAYLADLYDSIALAYEHTDQLELARTYYQRSIDLHSKLNQPAREAEVCWHQAVGCKKRQEWFNLEHAATRMFLAAERAQAKPLMLIAQRLLALSQINQNRPFKTLEHISKSVLLARELKDEGLAADEDYLRRLLSMMRPHILQMGKAEFMEPLVRAETVINDPNLAHDKALLQKWQSEQPPTLMPGSLPVGALDSLEIAAMVLEHFALRHCGPSTRKDKLPPKGLMGVLFNRPEIVERRVWAITREDLQLFHKDDQGRLLQRTVQCAVLTLFGQPEVTINVSLTPSVCNVKVMEERPLGYANQTGFFSVANEDIPLQSEALLLCLNSFIQRGLFVKTEQGLRYVSPGHS